MTAGQRRSELRSASWLKGRDISGYLHRATIRATGLSAQALEGKPVIGISNSRSEVVNCNLHLRSLANAVRRGVFLAGGVPLEFPTISLGENLMKPTTMLYRNLMAMDVEESIRSYPFDAVVLLGACDKTIPAQLLGAVSADVPAILLPGGPASPAIFEGREMGVGTDLWRLSDEVRSGKRPMQDLDALEAAAMPTPGHCPEMGSASTMACLSEALGVCLPGAATIPAVHAARSVAAEEAGRQAVQLAEQDLRLSDVLTGGAIDNAITLLMAIGGSTNAVIHLLALAGRAGVPLTLDRFAEIARRTPVIVNARPSGEHLLEHVYHAGGVQAILAELAPLLDLDARTVTGSTLDALLASAPTTTDRTIISTLGAPFQAAGGLAVVRGSLAPKGAILKTGTATTSLLRHRGTAVVFDDIRDLEARYDDPDLDVTGDSVMVLRNAGPVGGPGMPEWGSLPIPAKLLRRGVTDILRISDGRMSGTAFGTVVLHVSPEAAVGGPLKIVRDGDPIVLDVDEGRLDLDIPATEIRRRLDEAPSPSQQASRGYEAMHATHVLQADEGCDFDFLRGAPPARDNLPTGLLSGWIGGW